MTDARQAYHEGRRPKATDDIARQVAIERYSWGKIAERLEQIYAEVA